MVEGERERERDTHTHTHRIRTEIRRGSRARTDFKGLHGTSGGRIDETEKN